MDGVSQIYKMRFRYGIHCLFEKRDSCTILNKVKVKVKFSRYRPGVVQRVGRGIALLFHDRGTRRG